METVLAANQRWEAISRAMPNYLVRFCNWCIFMIVVTLVAYFVTRQFTGSVILGMIAIIITIGINFNVAPTFITFDIAKATSSVDVARGDSLSMEAYDNMLAPFAIAFAAFWIIVIGGTSAIPMMLSDGIAMQVAYRDFAILVGVVICVVVFCGIMHILGIIDVLQVKKRTIVIPFLAQYAIIFAIILSEAYM
jgi:hypothetical protein